MLPKFLWNWRKIQAFAQCVRNWNWLNANIAPPQRFAQSWAGPEPSGLFRAEALSLVSPMDQRMWWPKKGINNFSFSSLVHYDSVYIENFLREDCGKCKSYLNIDWTKEKNNLEALWIKQWSYLCPSLFQVFTFFHFFVFHLAIRGHKILMPSRPHK